VRLTPASRLQLNQEAWQLSRVALVPPRWAREFLRKFETKKRSGPLRDANLWMLETTEKYQAFRIPANATDEDICHIAKRQALQTMDVPRMQVFADVRQAAEGMADYVRRWGIEPPDFSIDKHGVMKMTPQAAIARMTCAQWWRRRLRAVHAREVEGEAVRLGFVHRKADIYVSHESHERRIQQRKRNANALENTIAENDQGQQFTLAELSALTTANPRIRRGELMTRIAGFEEIAKAVGHAAEFVTLTCPSAYHARLSVTGEENPRYAGYTPRESQGYLSKMWQRIRAALDRAGVGRYGFRIAEPHHDGCAHWHMILFMAADAVGKFREIMTRYALRESPNEPGAQANRIKFESINFGRGSAAGYVAKYVAKNVDGFGVENDLFGNPIEQRCSRVEAWASTWGIRQFQPVGGPPVTVWRELRRMGEGQTEATEKARAAADVGDWAGYVRVNGGAIARRDARPLTLARTRDGERWNNGNPEPAPLGRYGEVAKGAVYGVLDIVRGVATCSRRFVWRILRGATGGEKTSPWSPVNNCTEGGAMLGLINGRKAQEAAKNDGIGSETEGGGSGASDRSGSDASAGGGKGKKSAGAVSGDAVASGGERAGKGGGRKRGES
jgi:hypothetical protein